MDIEYLLLPVDEWPCGPAAEKMKKKTGKKIPGNLVMTARN